MIVENTRATSQDIIYLLHHSVSVLFGGYLFLFFDARPETRNVKRGERSEPYVTAVKPLPESCFFRRVWRTSVCKEALRICFQR